MARFVSAALICTALACAGCASTRQNVGDAAGKSYEVTAEASGQVYSGFSRAASTPLRDLNLIRDKIPPVLIQAEARPYAIAGLDSCDAIMAEVTALDQALGPDVDQPLPQVDNMHKGASYAAQAALDGVKDLTEGVLPMRSWVKRLSGAARAEMEARRAVMAGSVRRGFLKALGMQHNCEWPAAPMGFMPAQIAAVPPPPPPGTPYAPPVPVGTTAIYAAPAAPMPVAPTPGMAGPAPPSTPAGPHMPVQELATARPAGVR